MPAHKKVPLAKIKTLTFHRDRSTTARRTDPIPQLTCVGKPCEAFQPESVQCINMGDDGIGNIQWKCDTDLPSSLRLGRVEVSCEGWTNSGDKNILQGSCGLTYNLHRTDNRVFNEYHPSSHSSTFEWLINRAFNWIFILVLATLTYTFIRSILLRFWPSIAPPPASSFFPWSGNDHHHGRGGGPDGGGGPGGGGGGGGWYGGSGPGSTPGPPPPYTKDETSTSQTDIPRAGGSSGPGFWAGLAVGGTTAYLAATRGNNNQRSTFTERYPNRMQRFDEDDRGVGSSNLGEMRRATGFGGTSNR